MRSLYIRLISTLRGLFAPAALAACVLLCGCGKAKPAADNAGAKMTGAQKPSTTPSSQTSVASAITPSANRFLSVFSTENARDPFNPKAHPRGAVSATVAGVDGETDPNQLAAAVQAGFQGIFGSPDARELMVHGVLLRENRQGTITVPVNGRNRQIKVRPTRIFRNTAELQVEGVPQIVALPKAGK
jgi:hypothetical protein